MGRDSDAADDWDDETASVGRPGAIASVSVGQHALPDETQLPPEAVIDALVEVAWAYPGLRVGYGRFAGPRMLRFVASAGADERKDFTGSLIDLSVARDFLEALREGEQAVIIEDVETDRRTKPIAEQLLNLSVRSLVAVAVTRPRYSEPAGIVSLDSDRARTWSAKEAATVERLAPLTSMALDNVIMSESLAGAQASIESYERHLGGVRGLVRGVLNDANTLLNAVREHSNRATPAMGEPLVALADKLNDVLAELNALNHGYRSIRTPHPIDLSQVISNFVPALRAVLGPEVRLLCRSDDTPIMVNAYPTGLERMLLNLIVHARANRQAGASLVLHTRKEDGDGVVTAFGDAVGLNDELLLVGSHDQIVTADQLSIGLWAARCEMLLQGASLSTRPDADGQVEICLRLPLVES